MCCDSFTISNDNKQEIYISFTLHLHLFNTSLCLQVWTKLLFIPDRGECQLLLTFKRVGIKRNKIIVSKKIQVAFQTPLSLFFLSLSVNLTDTHAKQQENAKHRYIWHSWVQHTDSKKKKKKKKRLCDSTSKYRVDPKPQNTLCCLEERHTNYPDRTSLSVRGNITIDPDH